LTIDDDLHILVKNKSYEEKSKYTDSLQRVPAAEKERQFDIETSLGAAYGSSSPGDAMTWVHVTELEYHRYSMRLIWQHINDIGWHRDKISPLQLSVGAFCIHTDTCRANNYE
jgi:hypothetical protein